MAYCPRCFPKKFYFPSAFSVRILDEELCDTWSRTLRRWMPRFSRLPFASCTVSHVTCAISLPSLLACHSYHINIPFQQCACDLIERRVVKLWRAVLTLYRVTNSCFFFRIWSVTSTAIASWTRTRAASVPNVAYGNVSWLAWRKNGYSVSMIRKDLRLKKRPKISYGHSWGLTCNNTLENAIKLRIWCLNLPLIGIIYITITRKIRFP